MESQAEQQMAVPLASERIEEVILGRSDGKGYTHVRAERLLDMIGTDNQADTWEARLENRLVELAKQRLDDCEPHTRPLVRHLDGRHKRSNYIVNVVFSHPFTTLRDRTGMPREETAATAECRVKVTEAVRRAHLRLVAEYDSEARTSAYSNRVCLTTVGRPLNPWRKPAKMRAVTLNALDSKTAVKNANTYAFRLANIGDVLLLATRKPVERRVVERCGARLSVLRIEQHQEYDFANTVSWTELDTVEKRDKLVPTITLLADFQDGLGIKDNGEFRGVPKRAPGSVDGAATKMFTCKQRDYERHVQRKARMLVKATREKLKAKTQRLALRSQRAEERVKRLRGDANSTKETAKQRVANKQAALDRLREVRGQCQTSARRRQQQCHHREEPEQ